MLSLLIERLRQNPKRPGLGDDQEWNLRLEYACLEYAFQWLKGNGPYSLKECLGNSPMKKSKNEF